MNSVRGLRGGDWPPGPPWLQFQWFCSALDALRSQQHSPPHKPRRPLSQLLFRLLR